MQEALSKDAHRGHGSCCGDGTGTPQGTQWLLGDPKQVGCSKSQCGQCCQQQLKPSGPLPVVPSADPGPGAAESIPHSSARASGCRISPFHHCPRSTSRCLLLQRRARHDARACHRRAKCQAELFESNLFAFVTFVLFCFISCHKFKHLEYFLCSY